MYTKEQIKKFVNDSRKNGYTDEQIWKAMTNSGVDKKILTEVMPKQKLKVVQTKVMNKSETPKPVKVIGIYYYVISAIVVFISLGVMIFGTAISAIVLSQVSALAAFGTVMLVLLGIVTLLFGVLYFFVARGLFRGQNWARVVALVFSILGITYALLSLAGKGWFSGILALLINGTIFYYLLLNKNIRDYFDSLNS